MPTYSGNAYEILSQVRYGLNEYSSGLVQGTDATGTFQNQELMRHINNAQYYLWAVLFKQFPEYFLTSTTVSISNSVGTLPSDCFKIRELSDSDGYKIYPINLGQRHSGSADGSSHYYYRYGNTIRLDADSVSMTATIWYYSRCREIDTGAAAAGSTAAILYLASTAKAITDYYNNMVVENFTASTVDTITDYTTAKKATVTNTWTASTDYYGIVSDLPEIIQPLIAARAIITMKMTPRVPVALTRSDLDLFRDELGAAMRGFAGTFDGDISPDELFNDFEPTF